MNEEVYICVYLFICAYIGILAVRKNEILPFATTWMELECIMLSETSQRKTNTIWVYAYLEFKKQNR